MNREEILLETISDPGQPLAAATKDIMESRFGAVLGDVRIHYSAASDSVNRTFGSLAFTIDNHIGFKAGFNENCGLLFLYVLAHELVHVLQKRKSREAARLSPTWTNGLASLEPALLRVLERLGKVRIIKTHPFRHRARARSRRGTRLDQGGWIGSRRERFPLPLRMWATMDLLFAG